MTADPNAELLDAINRYESLYRQPRPPFGWRVACVVMDATSAMLVLAHRLTRCFRRG